MFDNTVVCAASPSDTAACMKGKKNLKRSFDALNTSLEDEWSNDDDGMQLACCNATIRSSMMKRCKAALSRSGSAAEDKVSHSFV